ncbi:FMI1 protein [Xylogone sp. PMI_703]|nr:FMI1 protein [Xylogone sp. PMI_703]
MSLRLGVRSSWRMLSLGTGVTQRWSSRAVDPSFPTIPTCPSPTCECAQTPEMPPGLEIDHKRPLNGTMAAYAEQVLICTGKDDWPSRIEEENSGDNLAADIKELLGKGGIYSDPFHNVSITNSSFPSSESPRGEVLTTSAYILPSFKYVPFLPRVSFDSVQALVKGYLLPTKLNPVHDTLSPIHKDRLLRSPGYQNLLYGVQDVNDILVLICGHGGRDMRCGITGPILRSEFEHMLPAKDVRVLHGPVNIPLEPAENKISGPETVESSLTARVGVISHIGGHKFAGNVILYIPPNMRTTSGASHPLAGCGIWYGRVEPKHVEGIIQETILNGNVITDLFRGGIKQGGQILRL